MIGDGSFRVKCTKEGALTQNLDTGNMSAKMHVVAMHYKSQANRSRVMVKALHALCGAAVTLRPS